MADGNVSHYSLMSYAMIMSVGHDIKKFNKLLHALNTRYICIAIK